MVELSIIIVSYNTRELTVQSIQSIIDNYQEQLDDGSFEIILVDNNSTDRTIEAIGKLQITNYKLQIIRNKENYGFSKGNNIGATKANGTYLLFLNSDTEVLDKGLLGMVDFLNDHQEVGILGGKLLNADRSPQPSSGVFYTLKPIILMLLGAERFGLLRRSPKTSVQVDWVSGGAMMIRKKLFEKLDGFDEHFFMYIEDMELCFRAKKDGFASYFYSEVAIVHKTLGSSDKSFAIINIYKGILYFYKKHMNYIQYTIVKTLLIVKAYIAILVGVLTGNRKLYSTYTKALSI